MRCVATDDRSTIKQRHELEDCFTEDADADWGTAGWNAVGRKNIYAFLHDNESRSDLRLSHFGHNPEVEILSEHEARAIFKLEDWVTIGGMTVMRGYSWCCAHSHLISAVHLAPVDC